MGCLLSLACVCPTPQQHKSENVKLWCLAALNELYAAALDAQYASGGDRGSSRLDVPNASASSLSVTYNSSSFAASTHLRRPCRPQTTNNMSQAGWLPPKEVMKIRAYITILSCLLQHNESTIYRDINDLLSNISETLPEFPALNSHKQLHKSMLTFSPRCGNAQWITRGMSFIRSQSSFSGDVHNNHYFHPLQRPFHTNSQLSQ